MEQIRTFSDERYTAFCAYCGAVPNTRDHGPSRILLDAPYPENLPVVPCCYECNNGISADEEYFATLLQCLVERTDDLESLRHDKVRRILQRKPALHSQVIAACRSEEPLRHAESRTRNMVLKLAFGHVMYENADPCMDPPAYLGVFRIGDLAQEDRRCFEATRNSRMFPEVGSRLFTKVMRQTGSARYDWINVQDGVYRYNVAVGDDGIEVRIVMREYVGCQVLWGR